jgi:UDP-N-acetyl-D-mannosaminuronic acid dehydrogenase
MIDPFETDAPMLRTARRVNDSMPQFTVEKLREEFAAEGTDLEDTSVLILGLTYRPGVEEIRASPSLEIAEQLSSAGSEVYGVDPLLEDFDAFELAPIELESIYERDFDGVVLVTPHEEFEDIQWKHVHRESGQLIVIDGRDTLDSSGLEHRVYTIGTGFDV